MTKLLSDPENQNLETPVGSEEDLENKIPPTPNPQDSVTSNDDVLAYLRVLEGRVQEQTAENKRLREELTAPPPPPKPPRDKEALRAEFFDDPDMKVEEKTRNVVREELAIALEPMKKFVAGFQAQDRLKDLKNEVSADPQYRNALADPDINSVIDSWMETQKPEALNINAVKAAILSAVGAKSMGFIKPSSDPNKNGDENVNNPNPPKPPIAPKNTTFYPPHMRSTGPTPPVEDNKKPKREYTENERLIMRMRGMTEEQYDTWTNMPAGEVASATFDKPPKK